MPSIYYVSMTCTWRHVLRLRKLRADVTIILVLYGAVTQR